MREFENEIDVENWLSEYYSDLINYVQSNCNDLSSGNPANLLYAYGGSGYKLYNPYLWLAKGDSDILTNYYSITGEEYILDEISVLNRFIKAYPVNEDIVLYRYERLSINDVFAVLMVPNEYTSKSYGFSSTTLLPYSKGMKMLKLQERYNTLNKYYVTRGVPLIPLQFKNEQTTLNEYEMLLPIGIEKRLIKKTINWKHSIIQFEYEISY